MAKIPALNPSGSPDAGVEGISTELALIALHGPAVPLADVCEKYFGLSYREACRAAALNRLGVPTFRLRDSHMAPVLVRACELAQFLDGAADAAAAQWGKSQL